MSRILIIEDDETIRKFLADFLWESGLHKVIADIDSFEKAAVEISMHAPDLIITDVHNVNSPKTNGIKFLQSLKSDPVLCGIPVIVMSGADWENQAIVLGAEAFISKPFLIETMSSAVRHALSLEVAA